MTGLLTGHDVALTQVSGSGNVLCLLIGGVIFLLRIECALTPLPEPVYKGGSDIMVSENYFMFSVQF